MDTTINKIQEYLAKSQTIGVLTPKDPNLDQMGGALALYLSLSEAGRNVVIATPNDPLVEVGNLVGIDKVKTSIEHGVSDLIVSIPYNGEAVKASFTQEPGSLNLVFKAEGGELNFDEKDIKYIRPKKAPQLLFIVGTSRILDLGKLFDASELKDTIVVNIDNSSENQGFGDIVMVSTKLSSVSEQVANLLLTLGLPINQDIAQNLMDGISLATKNFQSPKTSALAFEMAGILMRQGASREPNQQIRTAFTRSQRQDQPSAEEVPSQENTKEPPQDWLAPKIYKGSTNFEG